MTSLADLLWAELLRRRPLGPGDAVAVTKPDVEAALTEAGRQFRAESDTRGLKLSRKATPPRDGY